MAFSAMLYALIVTIGKPFASPLFRSVIISVAATSPAWANRVLSSSWVVAFGRLPTNTLAFNLSYFLRHAGKIKSCRPKKGAAAKKTHGSNLL